MNEPVAFLWQVAWQLDPAVVGATAAVVVLAILAATSTWQAAASRLAVVVMLVVMLGGLHREQPQSPAQAANSRAPQLVDLVMPAVAVAGEPITAEAIAWEAESGKPRRAAGPPMVELVDEAGRLLDRAALEPTVDAPFRADAAAGQGRLWRAELTWQPAEAGVHQCFARHAGQSSDSTTALTSRAVPAVCGVAERPLQVLLIDASARWEIRHLSRLLRGTPGVEVTLILLDSAAVEQLPRSRQAAAAFDVVVLGSFDPRDLPAAVALALVEAAEEDGLGVLWSLDGRSDLANLAASPLGVLLPCTPAASSLPQPATRGHRVWAAAAADGFRWLAPLLQAIQQTQAQVFLPASIAAQRGTAIAPLLLSTAARQRSQGRRRNSPPCWWTTPPPAALLPCFLKPGGIGSQAQAMMWMPSGGRPFASSPSRGCDSGWEPNSPWQSGPPTRRVGRSARRLSSQPSGQPSGGCNPSGIIPRCSPW